MPLMARARREDDRAYFAAYREKNSEQISARTREWYQKNLESERARHRAAGRKRRLRKPEASLAIQLRYWFGLSIERYHALLGEQNGLCRICRGINDGKRLAVDHEHVPGFADLPPDEKAKHVRGLLCDRCNHGLGHFRDSPDLLRSAVEYLGARRV